MSELRIDNIYCGYSGRVECYFGDQKMEIQLDDKQVAEVKALALRFVQARQQALADAIASAQPALLMPPGVEDAAYDEVSA